MLQKFAPDGTISDAADFIVYFENDRALTPLAGGADDLSGAATKQ